MRSLKDRVVLVTGGGSGIGLACARAFLEQGAKVAITGRTLTKLEEAARALGHTGRVYPHAADVSELAQVQAMVAGVQNQFGPIDILVNNAGLNIKERTMSELTPENWRLLLRGNLEGAYYCMYAVLPEMRRRREGQIINVNSIAGKRANPLGGVAYAAAKFGLTGLATSVGAEERVNGIRVSSVYPGEVDTPILVNRPTPVTEEHRKQILQGEDVAAAVLFIAQLPEHVNVPELIITPTTYAYI